MATTPKKKGEPGAAKQLSTMSESEKAVYINSALQSEKKLGKSFSQQATEMRILAASGKHYDAARSNEVADLFDSYALEKGKGVQREQQVEKTPAMKKKRLINANLTGNVGILGSSLNLGSSSLLGGGR